MTPEKSRRALAVLFVAAALANLAPVVRFAFLPTRDGPAHTFSAALIRSLLAGDAGPAASFVRWNPAPVPNWLGHAVLVVSGEVVGPWLAERFLIALIVVSLPFALKYAVRAITPEPTGLEFIALPLVWGTHLHWGFYNFCLGLTLYLVSVGYWLRHRADLGTPQLVRWAALLALAYFASALALLHAICTVAILALLDTDREARRRIAVRTALAMAPAAALMAAFVVLQPSGPRPTTTFPSALWAAASLVRLDILRAVDPDDHGVAAVIAVAFWCLVAWALLRPGWAAWSRLRWVLLVVVAFDVCVLFGAPTTLGGGTLLTPRQAFFVVQAVVLCLAADPRRLAHPLAIAAVAILLTVALHMSRWNFYADYDRAMREFVAAGPAAVTGQIMFAAPVGGGENPGRDPQSGGIRLSDHAGAYIAIARGAVLVNQYELLTTHFPLVARRIVGDGSLARAAGDRPLAAVLLWHGSTEEKERLAVGLLGQPGGDCRTEEASVNATTLFRTDCQPRQ